MNAEVHDPRPVERVFVQLWVEVLPAQPGYAMKYVGNATHEVHEPIFDNCGDRSMERFSAQDVADTIRTNLRRDLDSMWAVGRIEVATTCRHEEQFNE